MRVTVFGYQPLDFTTADGTVIKGKSIFVGFENRNVKGLKTNKFFVPATNEACAEIDTDMDLELSFDYNGKIDKIAIY